MLFMFVNKYEDVWCPVGDHINLGRRIKGRVCALICHECQFKHTWDEEGRLVKSEKLKEAHIPEKCGCGVCGR